MILIDRYDSTTAGATTTSCEDYAGSPTASLYYASSYCYDEPEPIIPIHNFGYSRVREKQEHFYILLISLMFNIYKRQRISRLMFSKSGFCGRVAKRRKGK